MHYRVYYLQLCTIRLFTCTLVLACNSVIVACVFAENDVIMAAAREMSTWSGETTSASDVTCYAYLQHGGLFIRANTVLGYCEANRQVNKSRVHCCLAALMRAKDESRVVAGLDCLYVRSVWLQFAQRALRLYIFSLTHCC